MACKVARQLASQELPTDINLETGKVIKIGAKQVVGAQQAIVSPTQAALTLTSMTGTANTAPAAETNIDTIGGTLTGTLDNTLADVTQQAGGAGVELTDGDAAKINKNFKEIQAELVTQRTLNTVLINDCKTFATQLNAARADIASLIALLKAHGLMASA